MILTDKIRHSSLTLDGDFKCLPNIRKNIIRLDSKRIARIYFYHVLPNIRWKVQDQDLMLDKYVYCYQSQLCNMIEI